MGQGQSLLKKKHELAIHLMHSHQNYSGKLLQWGSTQPFGDTGQCFL